MPKGRKVGNEAEPNRRGIEELVQLLRMRSVDRYECQTCRFWQRAGVGGPYPTCAIVGVRDDPWGGQAIHPLAWCGLWLEPSGELPLHWVGEVLNPSLTTARGSL